MTLYSQDGLDSGWVGGRVTSMLKPVPPGVPLTGTAWYAANRYRLVCHYIFKFYI